MLFARTAIIGTGMIGASFARALKKSSLSGEIVGCGRSMDNLSLALNRGYVDSVTIDPAEAVNGADLIVLAVPVEAMEAVVSSVSSCISPGALVVDVGSIKGELVAKIQSLIPDGAEFVGCHPIAGSERSGSVASVEDLFDGAQCIITPTGKNSEGAVSKVADLWRALGSKVSRMDPVEHDKLLGLVSHFPHLAAYAIINAIEDTKEGAISLSGAGLKDTTRIAMSPASLWRDICMLNRENIIPVIEGFIGELDSMKNCLREGDSEGLEAMLRKAETRRMSIED